MSRGSKRGCTYEDPKRGAYGGSVAYCTVPFVCRDTKSHASQGPPLVQAVFRVLFCHSHSHAWDGIRISTLEYLFRSHTKKKRMPQKRSEKNGQKKKHTKNLSQKISKKIFFFGREGRKCPPRRERKRGGLPPCGERETKELFFTGGGGKKGGGSFLADFPWLIIIIINNRCLIFSMSNDDIHRCSHPNLSPSTSSSTSPPPPPLEENRCLLQASSLA